jgi:hypothetical protein
VLLRLFFNEREQRPDCAVHVRFVVGGDWVGLIDASCQLIDFPQWTDGRINESPVDITDKIRQSIQGGCFQVTTIRVAICSYGSNDATICIVIAYGDLSTAIQHTPLQSGLCWMVRSHAFEHRFIRRIILFRTLDLHCFDYATIECGRVELDALVFAADSHGVSRRDIGHFTRIVRPLTQ